MEKFPSTSYRISKYVKINDRVKRLQEIIEIIMKKENSNMKLNKYIDHTLLKQDASQEQIDRLLSEAREYDFASVCVNPHG